jgi:hypothetical protein
VISDNQQGRILNIKEIMLQNIDLESIVVHKSLNREQTKLFIENLNKEYVYFKQQFNLNKDQVKRAKRVIFSIYENNIVNGFTKIDSLSNYCIDEYGCILNTRTRCVIIPSVSKKGYLQVCLTNKNTYIIHRLIALTFIENKENKPEVNHIDGNKLNNHISNLEWNTTQENLEHKRINNLGKTLKAKLSATGINNSQAKLDEEDVILIRMNCITKNDIKKFSKELNVSIATIYDIKNRRSWTHI